MIHQTHDEPAVRPVRPVGRRRERRERRTDEIVDTAMSLVVEHGVDALTLQRLATELSITAAALYRYFPSKDALLAALQLGVVEELGALFERGMAACAACARLKPRTAALLRVAAVAALYRAFAAGSPARFTLLARMLADPRPLIGMAEGRRVVEGALPLLGALVELLRAAAAAGALRRGDPMRRAVVLLAACHGVVSLRKFERYAPEHVAADALADDLVRALLTGWGAARADVDAAFTALARLDRETPLVDLVPAPGST